MRFVSLVNSVLAKARRGLSQSVSIQDHDIKDAGKLAETLRQMMTRVNKLESQAGPEATEFEVNVSTSGALVELRHDFKCPVRWWVTAWLQTSGVGYPTSGPSLAEDSSSTATSLFLRSYVAGRAVVRVEPAQAYLEPGIIVAGTPAGGGFTNPTGTGFVHMTAGVLDGNGGTGVASLGTGVATFLGTPSGANLATALTTALPVSKGGTGLTAVGSAGNLLVTDSFGTAMTWVAPPAVLAPSGVVTRGTFASRPGAGTAGKIYICTDGPLSFYDDGAAWQPLGLNGSYTATPAVAGLTVIQAGGRSTTVSDSKGGLLMSMTNGTGADDFRIAKKSTPAAAHTFIVHVTPILHSADYSGCGVCWRASGTGHCKFFGVTLNAGTIKAIARYETASVSTASPTFTFSNDTPLTVVSQPEMTFGAGMWLKLVDDGTTNRTYHYSLDGQNYIQMATEGRTANITPDEVGVWVANVFNTGTATKATAFFDSWTLTTP